jgi:hypothetical protein
LAVAFAPRHARAAELVLAQPSACAIGDELPLRAERAMGQALAAAAPVRCTIQIERDGDAFEAQMAVSTAGGTQAAGQRSFRAPTCELLADTLALAVALAVGERASEAPLSAVAAAAAAPATEAAAGPAPNAAAAPASAARAAALVPPEPDAGASVLGLEARPEGSALRWGARAGLVADAGTLPGLGLGATLGASLGVDWVEVRALGTHLPPRDSSPSRPGAHAEFVLLAAGLAVCAPRLVQLSALRAGACLGAEGGQISATGRGFSTTHEGTAWWKAARADVEGRWELGHGLGVDLMLSALAPIQPYRFVVEEFRPGFVSPWSTLATVHHSPSIVGRASIGLSLEFGGG